MRRCATEWTGKKPVVSVLIVAGLMRWTSILAIYVLFWTLSLFLVLPFGVRTAEEEGGAPGRGHAESAPHVFSFPRVALRATIVSIVLFGAYYANYLRLGERRRSRLAELILPSISRGRGPHEVRWRGFTVMSAPPPRSCAARSPPRKGRGGLPPEPLDRLGQRDVELAHVGGEQGHAERRAVAVGEDRGAASPRNRGCSGSPGRGNPARPHNGAGSRAPRPNSSSRTARRVKTPRSPLR